MRTEAQIREGQPGKTSTFIELVVVVHWSFPVAERVNEILWMGRVHRVHCVEHNPHMSTRSEHRTYMMFFVEE